MVEGQDTGGSGRLVPEKMGAGAGEAKAGRKRGGEEGRVSESPAFFMMVFGVRVQFLILPESSCYAPCSSAPSILPLFVVFCCIICDLGLDG